MWGGVSEVVGRMWGVWEEREEEEKCSNERRKKINEKKIVVCFGMFVGPWGFLRGRVRRKYVARGGGRGRTLDRKK